MDPAEDAPEHDQGRVEDVDERRDADAQPGADLGDAGAGGRLPRHGGADELVHRGSTTARRSPGADEHRPLTDLGLPAAERAAGTGRAVRVDDHVADLARVAGRPVERLATDGDAAADADLARHVDDVRLADRRAARCSASPPRSASLAIAIGASIASALPMRSPSGSIASSRGSARAGRARRGGGRPRRPPRRCRRARRGTAARIGSASSARSATISSSVTWARGRSTRTSSSIVAAEPDPSGGERVDVDLERDDRSAVGVGADEGRRAAGGTGRGAARLGQQPARHELADEAADGRSRQAGMRHELRARELPRRWTARTIALRFERRTVSLRWPTASRGTNTRFVFLSSKCCRRLVYRRGTCQNGSHAEGR